MDPFNLAAMVFFCVAEPELELAVWQQFGPVARAEHVEFEDPRAGLYEAHGRRIMIIPTQNDRWCVYAVNEEPFVPLPALKVPAPEPLP